MERSYRNSPIQYFLRQALSCMQSPRRRDNNQRSRCACSSSQRKGEDDQHSRQQCRHVWTQSTCCRLRASIQRQRMERRVTRRVEKHVRSQHVGRILHLGRICTITRKSSIFNSQSMHRQHQLNFR